MKYSSFYDRKVVLLCGIRSVLEKFFVQIEENK